MASAVPAYRYPERETRRDSRIRVVPGRGIPNVSDSLANPILFLARVLVVFVALLALVGVLKIALTSATVKTAVAVDEISEQIETARSWGNELEVRESHLTNPAYVKTEATKLDMSEASSTSALVMPSDVVLTDGQGKLSLSRSLQALSQG